MKLNLWMAVAFAALAGCYPYDLDWQQPTSEVPSQDAGAAGSGGGVAGAAGSSGSGGQTSQPEAGQVADGGAGTSLPDSGPPKGMPGDDAGGAGGMSGSSGAGGNSGSGGGIYPPDSGAAGVGGSSGGAGSGIYPPDTGTSGDGGSQVQTITFWIFGGPYWLSPLKFESYSPVFQAIGCQSANLTDPMTGQQNGAVVCVVNVDRSKDIEFQVQVGDKWATGWSSPPNCQKYLRIYAWNPFAVADYDDSSVTNFPQQMYSVFLGSTCHVVLPKAP